MNNQVSSSDRPDVFVVKTLEQARLLADEFKLKLLRAFAEQPTTVKRVAQAFDEKPTRLYRHIDALLDAGLLRVVREKPKRGTVERTLQAVASRFEADPSLFDAGPSAEGHDVIHDQFRIAADGLVASLSAAKDPDEGLAPICMRVLIQGTTPARLRELRAMLLDWIEQASTEPSGQEDAGEENARSANVMLVFHQNPED